MRYFPNLNYHFPKKYKEKKVIINPLRYGVTPSDTLRPYQCFII